MPPSELAKGLCKLLDIGPFSVRICCIRVLMIYNAHCHLPLPENEKVAPSAVCTVARARFCSSHSFTLGLTHRRLAFLALRASRAFFIASSRASSSGVQYGLSSQKHTPLMSRRTISSAMSRRMYQYS